MSIISGMIKSTEQEIQTLNGMLSMRKNSIISHNTILAQGSDCYVEELIGDENNILVDVKVTALASKAAVYTREFAESISKAFTNGRGHFEPVSDLHAYKQAISKCTEQLETIKRLAP